MENCQDCNRNRRVYTAAGVLVGVVLGVGAFYIVSRKRG
jgi:hypothetical protein